MQIGTSLQNAGNKAVTIPLAIVSIIIALYLLINGSAIFGSNFSGGDANQTIVEIYLILDVAVLFIIPLQKSLILQITAPDLLYWVPVFLAAGFVLNNIFHPLVPVKSASYFTLELLFQIFVVTFSETWIFLGAIQTYLMQKGVKSAFIWQAIMFGLFHYSAYGGSIISMAQAMAFGLIIGLIYTFFYQMKKGEIGLTIAWATHAAWNVALVTTLFIVSGL